jgi:hypothetical protein
LESAALGVLGRSRTEAPAADLLHETAGAESVEMQLDVQIFALAALASWVPAR